MSWQEPQWSRLPPSQYEWSLEEIKGGVVLSTHPLDKNCTTFGRAADTVTVPIAHESCSRLHARIAFDSAGIPWLRDLGSGNGTTVNKKRLPAKSIGKTEDGHGEGSRGVVLHPGDVINFGASTRMFCVVGPEEFDRGALAERRAKEKAALEQAKSAGATEPSLHELRGHGDEAVSWGIDAGDYLEDNNDARNSSQSLEPLETKEIPPKHRKLYERLMAKKYKLDNLRRETTRIENKSVASELTEGQKSQLEKNRQREEILTAEIDEVEQELRQKIFGSSATDASTSQKSRKRRKDETLGNDEDEDDFYDRTIQSKKTKHETEHASAETEQSLTGKWKILALSCKQQKDRVINAQRKIDMLKKSANEATDEDKFFIQNDLEIAVDSFKTAKEEQDGLEQEIMDIEKMLRLINAEFIFDRDIEFVGNKTAHERATNECSGKKSVRSNAAHSPSQLKEVQGGSTMMPPPRRAAPVGRSLPPTSDYDGARSKDVMPPLPKGTSGNMAPPPKRRARGPMRPAEGTLAAVLSAATSGHSKPGAVNEQKTPLGSARNKQPSSSQKKFDQRKDEWRAPSGQDGSGRTKLNEKFAGRY